ncbi:uncharacterized protein B0H18DRAFT_968319 [Fomitopsis serialis]|uniref:uncharacterized protein n=1 Tax=Fomitopsis serialis TaxID=139415 RepID=UPI00200871B6|nr:uncharacterized protein B0H18DRAFT_968319 [Neoantrodia serialis]KAH9938682.1 hypothetical protein B0H18DRAFT_968319 [Neoantrodia serialis]
MHPRSGRRPCLCAGLMPCAFTINVCSACPGPADHSPRPLLASSLACNNGTHLRVCCSRARRSRTHAGHLPCVPIVPSRAFDELHSAIVVTLVVVLLHTRARARPSWMNIEWVVPTAREGESGSGRLA